VILTTNGLKSLVNVTLCIVDSMISDNVAGTCV
jgi:hypothetical protein